MFVLDSNGYEQKTSPDRLRLKVAKFSRRRCFSTQLDTNTHTDDMDHTGVSSACENSGEKNSLSSDQLTADGNISTVQEKRVCKQEDSINKDVSLAPLSKSDDQSTCSIKSGKSTNEQNNPVVTSDQNLDGRSSIKISTEKKDVDSCAALRRRRTATKDSKKSDHLTSKPGTERSHPSHRSSSDANGSRHHFRHHHGHHLRDKPGTEQASKNEEQLVPPLKIRVEHRSKSVDQQTAAATYSVDSCVSEKVVDDVDVVDKTRNTKKSEDVPASAPTAHVTDIKTEKDVVPHVRDTALIKDDRPTRIAADQRRTRNASTKPTPPLTTKRRLSFEESLIAGTCISTISSSAVTTDSVKTSATVPSAPCRETVRGVEENAQLLPKVVAVTKPASVLNVSEKKELIFDSNKKIKLEDEKSAPVSLQNSSSTGNKVAANEVKMEQMSSSTENKDSVSDHVKSASHPDSVCKESESSLLVSKSTALLSEIKPDNKTDPISSDSKSRSTKSDVAGVVISKNEGSLISSVGAGSGTVPEEPSSSAKHSSSDRTSRHYRHHHHDHHHRHSSSSAKPHRMEGSCLDYELRQSRHNSSKYGSLMHVETDPNGGASVLHAFEDELSALSPRELSEFVREFFRVVFDEEPVGVPRHVMGIVHNSAAYLPDILEYFASAHPDMIVKRNHLGKSSDVETTTIGEYFQLVRSTYLAGTYRTGPLDHFSIVGTKAEETGGYFPEFLDLLDQNEFLKYISPWGKISELENMPRNESNDGPIVWARPGEQVVPTADMPKSPMVKKR